MLAVEEEISLYEISKILKSKNIFGCDISKYAIKNAKKEIKKNIFYHEEEKILNLKIIILI